MLAACPDLVLLVSSREALSVPGEAVWPAPPMDPTDAAALFLERAAIAHPDGRSAGPRAVERICEQLDGLPLAIELAAARSHVLSADEIADRLDDRLGVLAAPTRDRQSHHRTL